MKPGTEPDFLLLQKIKNGKSDASEQLIKKYYSSIYQYCLLHTHDRNYAEDLTQETFLHFFASLETYKEYGKTKNYLYRIAGNIIKNFYIKKKEILVEQFPEIIEESMKGVEIRLDIEKAVQYLPDEIKDTAILFFFQGLKQKEIAQILDIKLSLARGRCSSSPKKRVTGVSATMISCIPWKNSPQLMDFVRIHSCSSQ